MWEQGSTSANFVLLMSLSKASKHGKVLRLKYLTGSVAYPGVRDNRSTINTKTGYDEYKCYAFCSRAGNLNILHFICHILIVIFSIGVPIPFAGNHVSAPIVYSLCYGFST